MLMKADIMLLDEPTNHLDVKNVAWLEDYLTHLPDVTSMVVSHDSGFLDHVCTGIIHYENRKLKHYKVCTTSVAPSECSPANHSTSCTIPCIAGLLICVLFCALLSAGYIFHEVLAETLPHLGLQVQAAMCV